MFKEVWKDLFFRLSGNNKEHECDMWKQFQVKYLTKEILSECMQNPIFLQRTFVSNLLENSETTEELLEKMKIEQTFDEEFWKNLFCTIRDRETKPLDKSKRVKVIDAGHEQLMNIDDLEFKMLEEM